MEFLIELLGEFVFQAIFEIAASLIDGRLNVSTRILRRSLKFIYFLSLGLGVGAMSLAIWPTPIVGTVPNPFISLMFVPVSVAFFVVYFSRWIGAKMDWDQELEHFSFSFLFAFVFAATRYFYMVRAV